MGIKTETVNDLQPSPQYTSMLLNLQKSSDSTIAQTAGHTCTYQQTWYIYIDLYIHYTALVQSYTSWHIEPDSWNCWNLSFICVKSHSNESQNGFTHINNHMMWHLHRNPGTNCDMMQSFTCYTEHFCRNGFVFTKKNYFQNEAQWSK